MLALVLKGYLLLENSITSASLNRWTLLNV